MGAFSPTGATWMRDYVTDGVPASGINNPSKSQGRSFLGQLEAAIASGPGATKTDNYTLQTSDKSKLIVLNNSSAFKAITIPAASGFDSEHRNIFYNVGTRGWLIQSSGAEFTAFRLWPGQTAWLDRHQSSAWAFLCRQLRYKVVGNTTVLYVAPPGTGSAAATNDGLGSDAPLDTIFTAAVAVVGNELDLDHRTAPCITIQLMDGTYTSGLHMPSMTPTHGGNFSMQFQGNAGSPSAVIIDPNDGLGCFGMFNKAWCALKNMKFLCTNAAALFAENEGLIRLGAGITFGAVTGGAHIQLGLGGKLIVEDQYTISGNADYHLNVGSRGIYLGDTGASAIIFGANAAFTTFVRAAQQAVADFSGVPINLNSKTVTGQRYQGFYQSQIITPSFSGSITAFPGSTPGSVDASSIYV